MRYFEAALDEKTLQTLIALSEDWEKENSCHGYRKNTRADIEGNRVWLAEENGETVGYLFGHIEQAQRSSSIIADGTPYFELEEVYVRPAFRSRGVGRKLFQSAEAALAREGEAVMVMLSTATKNWRAILHFYLEELDMQFWNARLFKKL